MQFIAENWQLVFGGLGTAVVAAVIGAYVKYYLDQKARKAAAGTPRGQQIITEVGGATAASRLIAAKRQI